MKIKRLTWEEYDEICPLPFGNVRMHGNGEYAKDKKGYEIGIVIKDDESNVDKVVIE